MRVADNAIEEVGGWADIVEFCARLSTALSTAGEDNDRFEAWRPKPGERFHAVRRRTVDAERMDETRLEAASDGARRDMERAGGELHTSGSALLNGRPRRSVEKAGEAGEVTAIGIGAVVAKLARAIETVIYRHIIEPANPDYFEGDTVTAFIQQRRFHDDQYRVRVIFDDAAIQEEVHTYLSG